MKFEDQLKLRASLVLDYYKLDLKTLKDEDLNVADRERKQQVVKLLDYLSSVKIVDAPILMKLYDLYRLRV